ncbi:cytochrome c [Microvirga sp. STS02]|uniref:c-type cytochrome n=1 Tax=Hymenobacter negativus TaxID=2795026 RepID=UPI0018DCB4A3|nr:MULTISPECIES: cytochrome c [Bacteria]MBH8570958.1 cytochrome c [Hymenobacter negativus]MBR7210696.1 cytochrome c [Microvirga sp. STS02]
MLLVVVLIGFTLLSAAGLVGFAADDVEVSQSGVGGTSDNVNSSRLVAENTKPLTGSEAAEVAAGDALFKGNCAQCHAVSEQVVGPALAGITKRRPIPWILPWVKNSSKVVASGDGYAVALFTKFNKQQMPSFALSDKEITSIVAYINSEESAHMMTTVAVR